MRIVLIEDIVAISKLMTVILEGAGHEVTVFHAALPAVAALEGGLPCDLIITDYNLPDIPVSDLVRGLALASPKPILLYTGSAIDNTVIPPESEHRTRLLQKPFTPEALLEIIRQLTSST